MNSDHSPRESSPEAPQTPENAAGAKPGTDGAAPIKKPYRMRATQRTMIWMKSQEWTVGVVERFVFAIKARMDLFGVADIIACKTGAPVLAVQACVAPTLRAHIEKAKQEPRLKVWLSATGARFVIAAWRREPKDGKRGRWKRQLVEIVLEGTELCEREIEQL